MSRVLKPFALLSALALASCAPPDLDEEGLDEPEVYLDEGKADSFNWGSGTAAGSGTVEVQATGKKTIVIGKIPAGKRDVRISLTSTVNFDIQLYDGSTRVVYRTYGLPKGAPGDLPQDRLQRRRELRQGVLRRPLPDDRRQHDHDLEPGRR